MSLSMSFIISIMDLATSSYSEDSASEIIYEKDTKKEPQPTLERASTEALCSNKIMAENRPLFSHWRRLTATWENIRGYIFARL